MTATRRRVVSRQTKDEDCFRGQRESMAQYQAHANTRIRAKVNNLCPRGYSMVTFALIPFWRACVSLAV